MISIHMSRIAVAAAVALLLGMAGGCGQTSEAELLASAKALLEKKDRAAAVIQLKNALQRNPESGEARYLLGRALLQGGDGAAALIELERAHNLKFNDDLVLPQLAQAMLATGQAKKLTDLYGNATLGTPKATAELKAAISAGYVILGQMGKVEETLKAALAADPRNVPARLQMARLLAGRNAYDESLAQVEALIRDEPRLHEGWQLKAELLWHGKRDIEGAKLAFTQALAIEPRSQEAQSALATLLFQQRDVAGFKARVAEMRKALPHSLETRYYEAQVAILDNDYRNARTVVQQLVKTLPGNVRVLQLAATLELLSGSPLIAETHLRKILDVAPHLTAPRRLLAQTHLRAAEPDKALMVLRPLMEADPPRSEDVALAAEAYLHAGDPARAEEYFKRAAKLNPQAVNARTALALMQISKGNADAGFADLESLAATDRSSTYADMALISARLRINDVGAALKAIDRLQAKMPDDALPHHLRGRLLVQRGDRAEARKSFEKALAVDKSYFAAVGALAALDVADKRPGDARQRYTDVLAREPQNQRAMVALAQMMSVTGAKPAEVADLLAKAVLAAPDDAVARVAQIDFHLTQGEVKAAASAAEAGVAALPNDMTMLDAVGRVQLANGNAQQAIAAFGKAAAAQPGSVRAQLRLADGFIAAKDYDSATRALKRALELSPGSIPAQRGLVVVALARKRFAEALVVTQQLQKQHPTESVGWQLQSDVHALQRDWPAAISAMRESIKRAPSTEAAIRLLELFGAADRLSDADAFATTWRKEHPEDVRVFFRLASAYLLRRDHARAEGWFREVLALRPDDALTLNNVAWLMVQQNKPGALAVAERAIKLAPEQAQVMDTLALSLAADGQMDKALEWQRKAIAKAPQDATYKLGLARLLLKSGDKTQARQELEQLSKLGSSFGGQDEVTDLLKRL